MIRAVRPAAEIMAELVSDAGAVLRTRSAAFLEG